MESHTDFNNVVDFRIELGILGLCLLAGVIINLPAAYIYLKKKQLRDSTDKFIPYALLVDGLSMIALIPASFLLVLELEAISSNNHVHDGSPPNEVGMPIFLDDDNFLKGGEISITKTGEVNYSSYCAQQWIFVVHKFIIIMAANLSTLGALKFAIERYLAVVSPLHYNKILKSSTVLLASLISFLLSVLFALILSIVPGDFLTPSLASQCAPNLAWQESSKQIKPLTVRLSSDGDHFDDYSPVKTFQQPQPNHSTESLNNSSINLGWPVLTLVHATVFFILPLALMMYMYLKIWTEARKQNARMAHHNKNAFAAPADVKKSEINVANLQNIVGRFKLVQQIRRKTRMNRAARVAIFSIGLLIFSFGPLYCVRVVSAINYLIKFVAEPNQTPSESVSFGLKLLLPTFLACLHPLISPFFYIYRYKKVRTEWVTLFAKLISRFTCPCCRKVESTDCNDIVRQINQLAEKLPSSSSSSYEQMTESQPMSNTDSDTTITIDFQSALSTEEDTDSDNGHHGALTWALHPLTRVLDDNDTGRHEYSESDVESQECKPHPRISSPLQGGLLHMFNCWMHSYSRRWNEHRESVTSTASVITLLSNRSRSVPPTDT